MIKRDADAEADPTAVEAGAVGQPVVLETKRAVWSIRAAGQHEDSNHAARHTRPLHLVTARSGVPPQYPFVPHTRFVAPDLFEYDMAALELQ
jgi:hypothetical protein